MINDQVDKTCSTSCAGGERGKIDQSSLAVIRSRALRLMSRDWIQ